jgi:hypothetical protein
MHVEQVLGDVPKDQRCQCRFKAQAGDGAASASGDGLVSRFFGGLFRNKD